MSRNFLLVDPEERADVLHGLASPVRVRMLKALHERGEGCRADPRTRAAEELAPREVLQGFLFDVHGTDSGYWIGQSF